MFRSLLGAGLFLLHALGASTPVHGQCLVQKLLAEDAVEPLGVGHSVALGEDWSLVGNYVGGPTNGGSVSVFRRAGATWIEAAQLTAPDTAFLDHFGLHCALDGERALVGASGDNHAGTSSGSAHVFRLAGDTWVHEAKLIASDPFFFAQFGRRVALSGDRALIGAHADQEERGAAYLFERTDSGWVERAKLTASDPLPGARFGTAVALDGERALVGALGCGAKGPGAGVGYVFELGPGGWTEVARLEPENDVAGVQFGDQVALDGDRAVVSARAFVPGPVPSPLPGTVHVFERDASAPPSTGGTGTWTETAAFTAPDAEPGDEFGGTLALRDERLAVASVRDDDAGSGSGSVTLFQLDAGNWSALGKFVPPDGAAKDEYGFALALTAEHLLVGSLRGSNGTLADSGASYLYAVGALTRRVFLDAWPDQLSLSAGGRQEWRIGWCGWEPGAVALVLGSATGTSPGSLVDGHLLPLVPDAWFTASLLAPNAPPFEDSLGPLPAFGLRAAALELAPGTAPALAGATLHHAALLLNGAVLGVSAPVRLHLIP